ncbi:MAG: response regulator [Candidatus Aminicenantes bacterium]|nr:response regulator [Candidatus Aminicenantes bacterium]
MMMKNVAVVDDDAIIRKTLRLILNKQYNIFTAKDFLEAMQLYQENAIDLAIVDFRLGQGTGFDVIEAYRKAGFKGKALLITAFTEFVDSNEAKKLDIAQVFSKPLDLEVLTQTIEDLLANGQGNLKRA